jgi:hypothetical protein
VKLRCELGKVLATVTEKLTETAKALARVLLEAVRLR